MPEQRGLFADAARAREADLAQRLATSVEFDRSFEAILRGAQQYKLRWWQRLDALEAEIRQSAATWPGLDTPGGARQFQAYLAGKTREIHQIVADAADDSRQRAARVQALTGRYRLGAKEGPTPTPTPDPPAYDPADVADLFQKIEEWKRKNKAAADKVNAFNKKWPDGITFDMKDPKQAAMYREWKAEHDAAQLARNEVVQEYGEIIIEAGKFGGQVDESTGDIVWPDGTRTSMRPPE